MGITNHAEPWWAAKASHIPALGRAGAANEFALAATVSYGGVGAGGLDRSAKVVCRLTDRSSLHHSVKGKGKRRRRAMLGRRSYRCDRGVQL